MREDSKLQQNSTDKSGKTEQPQNSQTMTVRSSKREPPQENGIFFRIQNNPYLKVIVSFLVAVVVWLMVNTTLNPPKETTINSTLRVINRQALTEKQLVLINENYQNSIDIHIKGRQEDLNKLSKRDFDAVLDFSKVNSVEDTTIQLDLPNFDLPNITITRIEPEEIAIELENLQYRMLDIDVELVGTPAPGFVCTGFTYSPMTEQFTDRESLISQIAKVKAIVDVGGLTGNETFRPQCQILDFDGEELRGIGRPIIVDVRVEISKEVPIVPDVTGKPESDYYVVSEVVVPQTVLISGTKDSLEKINEIYTDVLNIDKARQNVSATRTLIVPDTVRISTKSMKAEVDISVLIERQKYTSITLKREQIETVSSSADRGYRFYIVQDEITLLLKGKKNDIDQLKQEDVNAIVDVTGLMVGTHSVPVIITLPNGILNINDVTMDVQVSYVPGNNGQGTTTRPPTTGTTETETTLPETTGEPETVVEESTGTGTGTGTTTVAEETTQNTDTGQTRTTTGPGGNTTAGGGANDGTTRVDESVTTGAGNTEPQPGNNSRDNIRNADGGGIAGSEVNSVPRTV